MKKQGRIYEMTQEQQGFIDRVIFLDEEGDEEELKQIYADMRKNQESIENMLKFLSVPLAEMDDQAKVSEGFADVYYERYKTQLKKANRDARARERLKAFMGETMQVFYIKRIKTQVFNMSVSAKPVVVVAKDSVNYDLLPDGCYKTERKIIKEELDKLVMQTIEEHGGLGEYNFNVDKPDMFGGVFVEMKNRVTLS